MVKAKDKEWMIAFLQNIFDKQIVWFTPWLPHVLLLYRCGDKLWVPLPGLWGVISYVPLMVVRQFAGKQFIPVTGELEQLEFSYKDSTTTKEIDQMVKSWKQTFRVNMVLIASKVTPEYAI